MFQPGIADLRLLASEVVDHISELMRPALSSLIGFEVLRPESFAEPSSDDRSRP
jgi:hypothetical protein